MARNPFIPRKIKQPKFIDLPKSAGILDDHAVRKNLATKEGTIEKVPVDDSDIANKKYVDDSVVGNLAVTSTNTIEDERIVVGDTGARRVRNSGVSIDDSNNITDVNDLTIENDLNVKGESKGSRVLITAGNNANYTGTEKFMKTENVLLNSTKGIPMPRAGSIVGISIMANCSSFTSSGTLTYKCYKGETNVFEGSYTISSDGVSTDQTTQARGTDTFNAGDLIRLSATGSLGFTINDTIICLELQFDT